MNRLFAALGFAFGLVCIIASFQLFLREYHYDRQLSTMHNDAIHGRAYMPSSAWKHEEKQLTVDSNAAKNSGVNWLIMGLALAVVGVVAWRRAGGRRKASVPWYGWIFWRRRSSRPYTARPTYPSTYQDTMKPDSYTDRTCQGIGDITGYPRPKTPTISDAEKVTAWQKDADRLAIIPAQDEPPPRDKGKYGPWRSGKIGESDAFRALLPLVEGERWTFVARNLVFLKDDGTQERLGDVDFVLVSPNHICYTIDAKNGHGKAWYDSQAETVKFLDYWKEKSEQREPYPVSRAWLLRDRAVSRVRQNGIRVDYQSNRRMNAAYALMVMCGDIALTREQNAYGLHLVRVDNLLAKLRTLDALHENTNRRELPDKQDDTLFSPLVLDEEVPKPVLEQNVGSETASDLSDEQVG